MNWNASYALLIAFSTIITYLSGIFLGKTNEKKTRKLIVGFSFTVNLLILFFYKYFNFFSASLDAIFVYCGIKLNLPELGFLLPVGISFYTFQALSYTVDVYRKEIEPEKNIGIYALFVSFFPQLVAGPIERSKHLLPQLKELNQLTYNNLKSGSYLILWGMFKKVVIADNLSIVVQTLYNTPQDFTGLETTIGVLFFSIQIFCDFSAYTDIARGVSRLMGIDLMKNFDSPYFSMNITEFWRRWHISLSTWFRDYMYIPLGGSRLGVNRTYLNLFLVFLTSGLWHGASVNFVIWGALHGILIVLEKLLSKNTSVFNFNKEQFSYKFFKIITNFLIVTFLWIFFRANTFADALIIISNLFNWDVNNLFNGNVYNLGLSSGQFWITILFVFIMLVVEYYNSFISSISGFVMNQSLVFRWSLYLGIVLIIFIFGNYGLEKQEFIYFQF
ncbi:MBOAT family O-acyltransferase [Formosa haliotis]|uniref:MBOAT family O-acyltransferase n=1 Tax=Formosa haliotis TaxID=1555194 RepID=UPI001C3FE8EB|nr:MBOAT family O-acyltransferase [Formosa haliotis]